MLTKIPQISRVLGTMMATLVIAAVSPASASAEVEYFPKAVNTEEGGTIGLSPARFETDVIPGQSLRFKGMLYNYTKQKVTVRLSTSDIVASANPNAFVARVEKAKYGAGSWVHPEITDVVLEPGMRASFDVTVNPPANAPVGSNYAGLTATARVGGKSEGLRVGATGSVLGQLFFNVPGEISRKGRIVKTEIADAFIFHGSSYVAYDVVYQNDGNVTDKVAGTIDIYSMFGNKVASLPVQERAVLRGTDRKISAIWTDPPKFGRFTAKANLKSADATHEADIEAVTVLPPWWWFVVLGAAVVLPLGYSWWRNRNDWQDYLDEDWDEDWDEEDWETSEDY